MRWPEPSDDTKVLLLLTAATLLLAAWTWLWLRG